MIRVRLRARPRARLGLEPARLIVDGFSADHRAG